MSLIKKAQLLRSRKGFTLIEVLCAVIIFGILMVAVFALFDPINKISQSIKGDSGAERLSLTVSDYIAAQFQTATDVELYWVDDSVSGAEWDNLGIKFLDFQSKNSGSQDLPHALIIKNIDGITYLYSINLKFLTLSDPDDINDLISTDALEEYRLFNRAFYDGIELDIAVEIVAPIPPDTQSVIKVEIDAYRNGDLRAKARRGNVTEMINIGKPNPYHAPRVCSVATDDRGLDDGDPATGWQGDYLILYNNFAS